MKHGVSWVTLARYYAANFSGGAALIDTIAAPQACSQIPSPYSKAWQIPRVAAARQLTVEQVSLLVAEHTQKPLASFIGMPVVNIVELNLALDALRKN